MQDDLVQRIAQHPKYIELKAKRTRFGWWLTLAMMLVYYGYAVPLSLKIGRGFYQDGIWADGGFIPYARIGGLAWREGLTGQATLVVIYRGRAFARRLAVPDAHYGAARRLLRDRIAAHDIHFTGKSLDLGMRDEREDV